MRLIRIGQFFKHEAAGGILLFLAALLALVISNSPAADIYHQILSKTFAIQVGHYHLAGSLLFWVNEGLMSLFFLLVGLELKREFLSGELSSVKKILLPGFSALGGMIVPALFYAVVNYHSGTMHGWPIPVATDIAFALGVLSMFGKKVPLALKLFLLALAIFDDVGAIIIIALFHSSKVSLWTLFWAGMLTLSLVALNIYGVRRLIFYLLLGSLLWLCVLKSGVHATVAGVVLAFTIPCDKRRGEVFSPLLWLEKFLHPWSIFIIMPLFAFVNAGLSFENITGEDWLSPIVIGAALGLFLGKQVGVFGFAWVLIRLGWAPKPSNTSWLALYGVSIICGIGFTMSLFLGTLAFQGGHDHHLMDMRLGVLLGSCLSGVVGSLVLRQAFKRINQ